MKRRLIVADEARQQIEAIYRYSVENWGEARAERYVRALWNRIEALAEGTLIARRHRQIPMPYLCVVSHRHVIVVRYKGDAVRVLTVLHSAMDLPAHLPLEDE